MSRKVEDYLEESKQSILDLLLPVKVPTWNMFEVDHQQPANMEDRTRIKDYFKNQTGNKNGLYVYKDQNEQILYIGKGKPLKVRLYSHYCESFELVKGDPKGRWFDFFSNHCGKLRVYWIELEDENNRRFVEATLSGVLNPKFDDWS
ncbi:hypothetical protein [Brevibacillus nitrificans]|uniref:hypothetical protein n=1 Tax=Brevibacillus nitrificans TaxID=651560 RepID=UPI00285B2BEF|nr:hypothetical protein [Brevibacillus nitrificans]MDR7315336.1 hypothetical protein [Brevibacillus nitrificans]